jgi:hypothetical protein
MKRFKSARHVQRFVSIHDPIANLFHFPRNGLSSTDYRQLRSQAMEAWAEILDCRSLPDCKFPLVPFIATKFG